MNNTSNFGETLKTLINFTGIKSSALAKTLGYDVSYISKWCSNKKLPSLKNIYDINDRAAALFSNEIIKQNILEKFTDKYEIDIKSKADLREEIQDILGDAFDRSRTMINDKDQKEDEVYQGNEETRIVIGKNEIFNLIRSNIKEVVEEATEDIEILFTPDVSRLFPTLNIEDITDYELNGIQVHARLGCNIDILETNAEEYTSYIYNFISRKMNCDITLYDNSTFDKENILVVKDKFAMQFSIADNGMLGFATYTTRKDFVKIAYESNITKFNYSNCLLEPSNGDVMQKQDYNVNFYYGDNFNLFCSRGFEFLLPPDAIENVTKIANETYSKEKVESLIKKIHIVTMEQFEQVKVNFIIPKSKMLEYIENGIATFSSITYKLTKEEMDEHIKKIIDVLEKNEQAKVILLDDEAYPHDASIFKLSVYSNGENMYIRKDKELTADDVPVFYKLKNARFIKCFEQYMDNLISEDYCREYSSEELEKLINNYKRIITKSLQIG